MPDSDSRLDAILKSITDVVYSATVDGQAVTFVSAAAESVYGWSPADFIADPMKWLSVIHPEDREAVEAAFNRLAENGVFDTDYRIIRRDGAVRWVHDHARVVLDETGRPLRLDGVVADITERRAAVEALAESAERLRLALSATNQGLYDLNVQTGEAIVSDEYARLLGYEPEEFHESIAAWPDRLHPEDRDRVIAAYSDYVAGRIDEYRVEFRQRAKSGAWKWISSRGGLVTYSADGRPLRMLGTLADISERKHAEAVGAAERAVLEMLSAGATLPDLLTRLALDYEALFPGALCAVLLDDGGPHALVGAAPSLPDACREAIEAAPVCLTVAAYQDLALAHGLCASDSAPVVSSQGRPFGAIAVFRRELRFADRVEGLFLQRSAHFAALAIERHQLSQSLHDSQVRLQTLVSHLPGMAYRCQNDSNWTMTYVSEGCESLTGYRPEELEGNRVVAYGDLVHADDREWLWEKCQASLDARTPCQNEYRILDRQGRERWVSERASGSYGADGRLLFVDGFVQDVTASRKARLEHEQLERAILETRRLGEQRLQYALEATAEGVWDWHIRTGAVQFSPQWIQSLGYSLEDVPASVNFWTDLVHPDDIPPMMEALQAHFDGRTSIYECENRLRKKSGEYRHNLARGKVVEWDAEGHPTRMVGTDSDITQRKRADDLIRANNALLEGVTAVQRQFLVETDSRRSFDPVLSLLLETTGSESGFIAEVLRPPGEQSSLIVLARANPARHDERGTHGESAARTGLEVAHLDDLLGAVMTSRDIVIANHPVHDPRGRGLPSGAAPSRAFLGIPFFHGEEMTGVVGLANRPGGYDDGLAQRLTPILATCSSMLHAHHLERQRQQTEAVLHFMATHDALTGLPNRTLLLDRLGRLIATRERDRVRFAVLFADLDNFKVVNDSLGHSVGDELLKIVAHRLVQTLRASDTVARFGGDEFILILTDIDAETLRHTIDRIVAVVAQPVHIGAHEIHTSLSIGVSLFPEDADDPERLLQNADSAMYLAKEQGKRTAHFFSAPVREAAEERLSLERDLRAAMQNGDLYMAYQPQVDLHTGALAGVEALVRWHHPRRGMVPPSSIILMAEKAGLMSALGRFVLDSALSQVAKWRGQLTNLGRMSVNLSAVQLRDGRFVGTVTELLEAHAVRPDEVTFEITESALIIDPQAAEARLRELKDAGLFISLDDFGTGYSSLSFLRRFPIDELKIDRSFIAGIDSNPNDRVIVQTVLAMARSLGRGVVAEGIETITQCETLRTLGCRIGQGFLFLEPCRPEQIVDRYLTVN